MSNRSIISISSILAFILFFSNEVRGCSYMPVTIIKTIEENATVGTVLPILDSNVTIASNEDFYVITATPTPFPFTFIAANVTINLTLSLDRETNPSYLLNIACRQNSIKLKETLVIIRLLDIDDTSPEWVSPPYTTSLNEGNLPNVELTFPAPLQRPQITDRDDFGSQTFRIEIVPDNYSSSFEITNPVTQTPNFRVKTTLDYEIKSVYNLTLKFLDLDLTGKTMFTGTALLTVNVKDVEDEAPKFQYSSYFTLVTANATRGRVLTLQPSNLLATDGDTAINATVNYALMSNSIVDINETTGELTINQDNPKPSVYYVFVKAFEVLKTKRESTVRVMVNVSADALTPVCVNPNIIVNVPEDFTPSQTIATVAVNYPDQSQLSYAVQTFTDMFNMSGSALLLIKSLDFENKTSYDVSVRVNSHTMSTNCVYRIRVTDINDHAPVFAKSSYTFTSSVSQGKGTLIGDVQATDRDPNDVIVYSISSVITTFSVDPQSGTIKINTTELLTENIYSFLVVATDNGQPTTRSGQVLVKVNVKQTSDVASANTLVIALAVLGGLLIFIIIVAAIIFFLYRKRSQKPSQNLTENQNGQTADRYFYENQAGPQGAPAWTNMPSPLEAMYKEYCTKGPITPDDEARGSAEYDDDAPCVNLGTEFSTGPGSIRSVASARSKTVTSNRQRITPTPVVDSTAVLSEVEGSIESYSINYETPPPSLHSRRDNMTYFL